MHAKLAVQDMGVMCLIIGMDTPTVTTWIDKDVARGKPTKILRLKYAVSQSKIHEIPQKSHDLG